LCTNDIDVMSLTFKLRLAALLARATSLRGLSPIPDPPCAPLFFGSISELHNTREPVLR
jgi:hypothetical protein